MIEYLLSFNPDICHPTEDGESLVESYFSGLYYSWDISWRPDRLDQIVASIELLAKRGARWAPTSGTRYNLLRAALRKIDRYKAISLLEKFVAMDLFGPGTFRTLMSTPKMEDLLSTDTLRLAFGQRPIGNSKRDAYRNR